MQIQITLTGTNMKQNAEALITLASLLNPDTIAASPRSTDTTAQDEKSHIDIADVKRGKRTAKKEAAPADNLDIGQTEEEEETPSEEVEEEKEEPKPAKAAKGPTLDGNIIPAFQAYAKKHSREKAGAVLSKFKVKSVRDLPEAKFGEVLKLLGA